MNVQIMSLIPACADDKINWSAIENQFASCGFSDLSQTPQNPLYHGEGIARDVDECLEKVELCRLLTDEAGCLRSPYRFPDAFTKRAYLSGRRVSPDHSLFDDTWGEVILLSGLPGTGKDTWIRENAPGLPMISLDEIRKELSVSSTDAQGRVIQTAHDRVKELLRKKRPFVWNATNLSKETRQTKVSLFEHYGARVRIVYLETDWITRRERNLGRRDTVSESAVERMLEKTVPPMTGEARTVEWVIV